MQLRYFLDSVRNLTNNSTKSGSNWVPEHFFISSMASSLLNAFRENLVPATTQTQIPLQTLVEQIKYKGQLAGIQVRLEEESYTSGVSAYDQEPVTSKYYDKGRRIKRGLFETTEGRLVNSDTNGSLNIMRKYLVKEELHNVVPILVKQWRDNGLVVTCGYCSSLQPGHMDCPVRLAVI